MYVPLAHAFRASDVFDFVEAFDLNIQPIKHHRFLTAGCVIAYHFIIDLFILSLVWNLIDRAKRRLLEDEEIRDWTIRGGVTLFAGWFIAWWILAFFVQRWRWLDIALWYAENVVRAIDFLDILESTEFRFHTLPRAGVNGLLTFMCRVWITRWPESLVGEVRFHVRTHS